MRAKTGETLGELLRRWRTARKLSQAKAAAIVGADQSLWSRWETGRGCPDPRHLSAISRGSDGELRLSTLMQAIDAVREAS